MWTPYYFEYEVVVIRHNISRPCGLWFRWAYDLYNIKSTVFVFCNRNNKKIGPVYRLAPSGKWY